MCRELRPRSLQALLLDAAAWLCCDDDTVHKLDTLCFGNLDGGAGTAAYVRQLLEAAGRPVHGDKAVRLSLDEAFFMAYALGILTVHELAPLGSEGEGGGSGGEAAMGAIGAAAGAAPAAAGGQAEAAGAAAGEEGGVAAAGEPDAGQAAATAETEPAAAGAVAAAAAPAGAASGALGEVAVPLDTAALWRRLQQLRPDFFLLYLAYHHFRSKASKACLCACCCSRTCGLRTWPGLRMLPQHSMAAHSGSAAAQQRQLQGRAACPARTCPARTLPL